MDIALRIDSMGATRGGAGTGRTYISETIDLIREWPLPFAVAPAGENDISVSLSHPFDLDPAPLTKLKGLQNFYRKPPNRFTRGRWQLSPRGKSGHSNQGSSVEVVN